MPGYKELADFLEEFTDKLDRLGIPEGDEDLDDLIYEGTDKLKTARDLARERE